MPMPANPLPTMAMCGAAGWADEAGVTVGLRGQNPGVYICLHQHNAQGRQLYTSRQDRLEYDC
ncbi:hypothetical protein P3T22_002573 [Paraburkholderia sp. GAS348]